MQLTVKEINEIAEQQARKLAASADIVTELGLFYMEAYRRGSNDAFEDTKGVIAKVFAKS